MCDVNKEGKRKTDASTKHMSLTHKHALSPAINKIMKNNVNEHTAAFSFITLRVYMKRKGGYTHTLVNGMENIEGLV